MKRRILIAAGAAALACGVLAAPTAAAENFDGTPCSERFRVPWALDAWIGTNKVVLSPYGAENIFCIDFKGRTSMYQLDEAGRKHNLDALPPFFGSSDSKVYRWNELGY